MEIDSAVFQDLESFWKRDVFQIGLCISFGFLFEKSVKYPEMDTAYCYIKHHICYVCSLHCS